MFYLFIYGRLILRPWLTEVRESFKRGGPRVSLEKLLLGVFPVFFVRSRSLELASFDGPIRLP